MSSPVPAGWQHVRLVAILGLLVAVAPLSIDLYLPAFPGIRDELQTTDAIVQLTLSVMLLGMGFGQLVIGPISDAFGRRRPLLFGLVAHAAASLLCAVAPTIEMLVAARAFQGLSGAAVTVTVMATVRDRFEGPVMARVLSRMMLVTALAPILAPSLGGLLLRVTDWRGIFATLMLLALFIWAITAVSSQESLPVERRKRTQPRQVVVAYASLLRDRSFISLAMIGGLTSAALFTYIGASSFIFQDGFDLSSQQFGLVFGINAVLFLVGAQLNPLAIDRFALINVMRAGNLVALVAAVTAVVLGLTRVGGVVGAAAPMGVVMLSIAMVLPNTPALALHRYAAQAGAAAAVIGCLQSATAGVFAPLVGALGADSAVPLGLVMTALLSGAAILLYYVSRDPDLHAIGGPPPAEAESVKAPRESQ